MYALTWKLLIIGLLSEYFATNVPYLFIDHTFSYGKVKDVFCGNKDQILSGKGKKGVWGQKLKMRAIFAKFPLLSKMQTLSHKNLYAGTFK